MFLTRVLLACLLQSYCIDKLDGVVTGFVKVLAKPGSGEIYGATIVAGEAGNMISEITVAMQAGMSLGSLAAVIHPYPTQVQHALSYCSTRIS